MKGKIIVISSLLMLSISLYGCAQDSLVKEAQKTEQENKQKLEEKNRNVAAVSKKEETIYKKMEKPIDEVIKEDNLDKEKVIDKNVLKKDEFTDPKEMAKYTGVILNKFYSLQITPQEFYDFIQLYGSKDAIKALPQKEDALNVLSVIQSQFKDQGIDYKDYVITDVTLNKMKDEAYFYRKSITKSGKIYNITTLVKENGIWKYQEDSPSPPFDESIDTK